MMKLKIFSLCIAALVFATSAAQAGLIGVNFNSDRENPASVLDAGTTAGVGTWAQANWNNTDGGAIASDGASGVMGSLVDSTGAATDASVTWGSNGTWNTSNGSATGDAQLMNGYIDAIDPNADVFSRFTITAPTGTVIDRVLAYVGSDGNGRTAEVTDSLVTYAYSTFSNDPNGGGGFVPGDYLEITNIDLTSFPNGNYAIFDRNGVAGPATIDINRGNSNSGFHGFQVEYSRISRIPEPSVAMLVGLGMIVLLVLRKRVV